MKSIKQIRSILTQRQELKRIYHVKKMGIFGSYVKNLQNRSSDVDIVITFKKNQNTFDNYFNLKSALEKLLKARVDLAPRKEIKKNIKKTILSETIYV